MAVKSTNLTAQQALALPGAQSTTLTPAATQTGYGPYGAVPGQANPLATQIQSLAGNTNVLSELLGLGQGVDVANAAGAASALGTAIPGYAGLQGQAVQNIGNQLAGTLSPDVVAQINQQAAEAGIATGAPGSPATEAADLRAMGLTSQQLQQQGQSNLTSLMGATPLGNLFDVSSQLVTPAEQQAAQQAANVLGAAPNPTQAAAANLQALEQAEQAGSAAGTAGGTTSGAPFTTTGANQLASLLGSLLNPAAGTTTTTGLGAPATTVPATYTQPGTGIDQSLLGLGLGPLSSTGATSAIDSLLGLGSTPGTAGTLGIDQSTNQLLDSILGLTPTGVLGLGTQAGTTAGTAPLTGTTQSVLGGTNLTGGDLSDYDIFSGAFA